MTTLAVRPVADPDQLALIADDWTPLGKPLADRFREACLAEADAHDGWVNPNAVRARVLAGGDFNPRQYSALWLKACARDGFLDKTTRAVAISGEGSRNNGNKDVLLRRWRGWGQST